MENLIETVSLKKSYQPWKKHPVYAVDDVSISIRKGEVLGLVGESGCGKSTLGKALLNLEPITEGKVLYRGKDISRYSFREMRKIRNQMQMVFQNSIDSFNPYLTVRQVVMEPLNNYSKASRQEKETKVRSMLEEVGLGAEYLDRYGSELSGGQRQRVGIARALIMDPEFVICDEAVSALDYAVRNKILRLLYRMKKEKGLTYLFISHDLSAVRQICDRVVVMYMGQVMEILPDLQEETIRHPYTKALLAASLGTDPRDRQKKRVLFKDEASGQTIPQGCPFQNRCLYAREQCKTERPILTMLDEGTHWGACHYIKEL
ncbi:MAG: ABC transporter ATP-binding protein [Oscillospiraceae bacterium]|nr:ABC transporter ATP-binding protein [Oscillospiraceae bacterium]